MLALPLFLLASFAVFFVVFFVAFVGLATASNDQLQSALTQYKISSKEDVENFQKISAVCLLLVFLWIYFFHIALYHTTIALTVSNSYFQGDLHEHHLCPSLKGGVRVFNRCTDRFGIVWIRVMLWYIMRRVTLNIMRRVYTSI